jgi:dihydropteroate synthase
VPREAGVDSRARQDAAEAVRFSRVRAAADRKDRNEETNVRLGPNEFGGTAVMAIINRTPDSFFEAARTPRDDEAMRAIEVALDAGADIIDIGGVKAGPGQEVTAAEEIDRVGSFVAAVRQRFDHAVISVDTWRAEVGEVACTAGADLINDAWGGHDPDLAAVAARYNVGLVCTHAGGLPPRTRPHRVGYEDVMADVLDRTVGLAERAVGLGVDPERILIDPGHDFGKNTRHSLEVTRRLTEMVETGWPVLVSVSRKDFIGETLDLAVSERLPATLATTAVCAWLGARVFRAHDVAATRQALDMVASIRGERDPVRTIRGLA